MFAGMLALLEERSNQAPVEYAPPTSEIPAAQCFGLLKRALNITTDSELSMRDLWNFVNVLYTSLVQLHDPLSPINAAMQPDPFVLSKVDAVQKESLKGEICLFLIRTARDFASNQPDPEMNLEHQGHLTATGFSKQDFNHTSWRVQSFTVSGLPVYKLMSRNYFLYFRAGSGKWCIDDEIAPSGAAYSVSVLGELNGPWKTSPGWKNAPNIRVTLSGSDVLISGCTGEISDEGASSSKFDNGLYVRQPASENINGKPHYVLRTPALSARGEQRHLIFSRSSDGYKVTPTCGGGGGLVYYTGTRYGSRGIRRLADHPGRRGGPSAVCPSRFCDWKNGAPSPHREHCGEYRRRGGGRRCQ